MNLLSEDEFKNENEFVKNEDEFKNENEFVKSKDEFIKVYMSDFKYQNIIVRS